MTKNNYILFILLLSLCYHSCQDNKKNINQHSAKKEEYGSNKAFLETYFSTIDIPYLLKEDVDSILLYEEKVKNDKQYRNKFITKAKGRRSGIRKLSYSSYKNKKVPFLFKRFLLPDELSKFNKDSLRDFVILYELYKKRLEIIRNITYYPLTHDEIQKLIQGSYKDSLYYKELSTNRYKKDSIESATRFNKIIDSLQSIIHPIDSLLPFGPKPLKNLIENKTNYLGFYVKSGDSLTENKKQSRKAIYDTWMYYLKLHPYVDADLSDDYEVKLLPPIKDYKVLDNSILSTLVQDGYEKEHSPINESFVARLSNITNYEVYYTTTGSDYPIGCGAFSKKEEDCCFFREGYDCNSTGYLILYNRKKEDALVIPAFILNNTQSYGFQLQFFYVKNNTIYIYQGYSMYDRFVNENGEVDRYLQHKEGRSTSAKGYKSVGIAKAYEIEILKNGEVNVKKINHEKN